MLPLSHLLLLSSAHAAQVDTGALVADIEGGELISLVASASGQPWAGAASSLYELGHADLAASLDAEALPDGQLLLCLTLENSSAAELRSDLVFPRLEDLGIASDEPLAYLFPALGPILDDEATRHVRYYGALFPMQFMELHQGEEGLWVMTRDSSGRAKTYSLEKGDDGRGALAVAWPDLALQAGETVVLQASIGVHQDDWHSALDAYRRWLRSWFQPAVPRNAAFREAFNLRQLHLHQNAVLGEHAGVFDPHSGSYRFSEYLAEDAAAFGGVDWVHIFDWGMDWVHGRVGDYVPFSYIGERELLVAELDAIQQQGMGVGLYVEGYLLDTTSLTGLTWGDEWELLDASGQVYTNYAPSWHVCPAVLAWQQHFATYNARRSELRLGASGLYVDQLGFGYQYPCHRQDHEHGAPSDQVAAEAELLWAARRAMSPTQVIYTEAAPADVLRQISDGAFCESVSAFRYDERTVPVNLARFGLPDFKTFQLLTQDEPLADDVEGVRFSFFNGEGQRLMGYLEDDDWFADETLDEIARAWQVLREHRAAFTSDAPVPLVRTEQEQVHANLFPSQDERLWTLYNAGDEAVSGVLLQADALPGDSWSDCWKGGALSPDEVQGMAQVELELGAGEVGCVVQSLPASPASLLAWWAMDETSGDSVSDSAGGATGTLWPKGDGPVLGQEAAHERLGSALWLDGADDAVSLGAVHALAGLTEDFSLAAWVRPEALGGSQRILAVQGWDDGGLVFGLGESGGQGTVLLTTVGEKDYALPVVVPVERWTHLAVVVDAGASVCFYVDGELRGSVSHHQGGLPTSEAWWLGSNGSDGFFYGALDDVRVYAGRLTAAELRALADIEPPMPGWVQAADGVVERSDALELWWPGFFDPGAGIASYSVSLGGSEGAADLWGPAQLGSDPWAQLEGLALPEGAIWATVEAVDGVGLSSQVSAELQVDTSHPALLGRWTFEEGAVLGEDEDPIEVSLDLARQDRASVAAWVAPAAEGAMTIFGGDEGGWSFGIEGDQLGFVSNVLQDYGADVAIPVGAWTDVAAVFDRWTDVSFYVDGELAEVVHGAIPALPASGSLWVGGGEQPWQGQLADVRLYDGELNEEEVAALFAGLGDTGWDSGAVKGDNEVQAGDGGRAGGGGEGERCGCGAVRGSGLLALLLGLAATARRRRADRGQSCR